MPSVTDLTALYGNLMLSPRRGPNVCDVCFNFTNGFDRCYACAHGELWLDAVCPISYSIAREQLHHTLKGYKRVRGEVGRRLAIALAAVLWRFLSDHEHCVAEAADTRRFRVVTTVPSGTTERDDRHPLRTIVGELAAPTRGRHERLLRPSLAEAPVHEFHSEKFEPIRRLSGESVLLIDDTWTTGANAQSAACALKSAGASTVAAVPIGRYLNREWHENDRRLRGITRPFDWSRCAFCADLSGTEIALRAGSGTFRPNR